MRDETMLLKNIEADLLKKLNATRELMKMFEPIEITQIDAQEDTILPKIKVTTFRKLIDVMKEIFNSDLTQKIKDNYALSAYIHYAKIMFPNTGFNDIGELIGTTYQTTYLHSKKHKTLMDKFPDYADYIKKIETKYSIKEVQ